MRIAEELLPLTAANVMDHVTDLQIFMRYSDQKMKVNTPFSSPFRDDKNPSFIIYERGFYKDFASGDKGNGIKYIMNLYRINFNQALLRIVYDFGVHDKFACFNSAKPAAVNRVAKFENARSAISIDGSEISVVRRAFNQKDAEYWGKYNLTEKDLIFGRIVPISHFYLGTKMFIAEPLAYAFLERKDGIVTYKIYQPMAKIMKWINNNNSSVWELWDQLPKTGKYVFVNSSRKDALCVWKLTGIPSTALQAESTNPKKHVMEELIGRFDHVILLFDNDWNKEKNWGQIAAQKLLYEHPSLLNLVIDELHGAKDPSDLVDLHKPEKAKIILRESFKETLSLINA